MYTYGKEVPASVISNSRFGNKTPKFTWISHIHKAWFRLSRDQTAR